MTEKTLHAFAEGFMAVVFAHIEHGDAEHRRWLKDKCLELVPALEACAQESLA